MVKRKIYIRADGSSQIGLGHLFRCIALAQMLEMDFDCAFFCKEIPSELKLQVQENGFEVSIINSEDEFIGLLTKDVIVVIDHYNLDVDYQKRVKDQGCLLVCIDDLHDKSFFADLIINHAPGILSSDYKATVNTQFALGLEYVLLRPIFLVQTKETIIERQIGTVFVCFGGSDSKNITKKAVSILRADCRFIKIIIVTGAAYNFHQDLENAIGGDKRVQHYNGVSPEVIRDLIDESDLAIVPASGILQETLALGCKVISGMYIENQKNIFEKYRGLNSFISANEFSDEDLKTAIDIFHSGVFQFGPRLIDGKSGIRILKYFKQFQKEEETTIRKVEERDLLMTFDWAKSPVIRSFFFNKDQIDFETHKAWFEGKLKNRDCFYYIGELGENVFGSIRFDVEADKATISYLVDPKYQNQGLGTILLKKGLDMFRKELSAVRMVCGKVFFENGASLKVFQKLGYTTEVHMESKFITFYKEI